MSAVAPGSGTPTGTVTFMDGATTLGTKTLSAGSAMLSTSALSVGAHSITAAYAGDASFRPSTSTILTHTVNKADTATDLVTSANPSVFGQPITFTASVAPVAPGAGTPTGAVTFKEGATTLGTATLSGGTASLSTSTLSVGAHSITAEYAGDASFIASISSPLAQTVSPTPAPTPTPTPTPSAAPAPEPPPTPAPPAPTTTPAPISPPVQLIPRSQPLRDPAFPAAPPSGYHARWALQSDYPVARPGELSEWVVAFRNTGWAGWYRGLTGMNAALGTSEPLDDLGPTELGLDPGVWPYPARPAYQTTDYVGPGQLGWFVVQLRAPMQPGTYVIRLRPVIDGVTWMEDQGVFVVLTVRRG